MTARLFGLPIGVGFALRLKLKITVSVWLVDVCSLDQVIKSAYTRRVRIKIPQNGQRVEGSSWSDPAFVPCLKLVVGRGLLASTHKPLLQT